LGLLSNWGGYYGYLSGYVDDFRVTKGVARYTANFTPPTEAHPTQGEATTAPTDPYFSNVSLLLPMDSDFSDSSTNNHTVTVNGNAAVSTTESKFGGGSGYFDGDDYLTGPTLSLGTQDFTMEAWIKRGGTDTSKFYLFNLGGLSAGSYGFYIQNGYIENVIYGMSGGFISSNIDVTAGVWTHVATVRQGSTLYTYVDGILVQTVAGAGNSITSDTLKIGGALWNQYPDYVGGYIDDVRITVGVARYTANFTPPTEAHPTS
jgi:hypothetical protein